MAYRFSDTAKWADAWFVDLPAMGKLMFYYLCDNCDQAGFIELSMRKLKFDLGLNDEEIQAALKGLERGYIASIDGTVLFIKNFIKHQKNLPLNPDNKSHKGILKRIENYQNKFDINILSLLTIQISIPDLNGASKGLGSPTGIEKGIGNLPLDEKKEKEFFDENFKFFKSTKNRRVLLELHHLTDKDIDDYYQRFFDEKIDIGELNNKSPGEIVKHFSMWLPKIIDKVKKDLVNGSHAAIPDIPDDLLYNGLSAENKKIARGKWIPKGYYFKSDGYKSEQGWYEKSGKKVT